jgi:error-prone DNA polymerase
VAPGYGAGEEGTQLSLPLDLPGAPELEPLSPWPAMVADYTATGLTTGSHPIGLLRVELTSRGAISSADMPELRHGEQVRIGGLVVARQRPSTAKGVVFLLLEDEFGTINLIVPPAIYERDRLAVRTEPLVLAEGVLERHPDAGGAINILVSRLVALDAADTPQAEVAELVESITSKDFSLLDAKELARQQAAEELPAVAAAGGGGGFRAVAPPVLSFTQGRRR